MFLSQLQVSGFKSFGGRAKLRLEPGITAIVGPNGSGKSNIADAVRWALGEQSVKSLRLKKSDELVFVGTDKKARASLAEVSLLLDNHDGGLAIDFSEVEITRRLYGNGDSDYLLNGKKVRLADIQHLLAQAGFGPNSYSVIGQGMIDSFILASPAERKQLFDDASGIRQFELKREQALKKLTDTESNLVRVNDILGELRPRLSQLERTVSAAAERAKLEAELKIQRRKYLAAALHHQQDLIKQQRQRLRSAAAEIKTLDRKISQLESRRQKLQLGHSNSNSEAQAKLAAAEKQRDELARQASDWRGQLKVLEERQEAAAGVPLRLQQLRVRLADLQQARQGLEKKLHQAQAQEAKQTDELEALTLDISQAQKELSRTRRQAEQSDGQDFARHALELVRQLARQLAAGQVKTSELNLIIHKLGRLLSHAVQHTGPDMSQVKQLQSRLTALMNRREELHERYTATVIQVRSVELDLSYNTDQTTQLSQQLEQTKLELQDLDLPSPDEIKSQQNKLADIEKELTRHDAQITQLRQQLAVQTHAATTEAIFELATELESAKSELSARQEETEQAEQLIQEAESESEKLKQTGWGWFSQHLSPAPADSSLEQLERDLTGLEARLSQTGAADAEAAAEYAEVKQRHDFLAHQVEDLRTAKADLLKVVEQLDSFIKDKFESAFTDISRQFNDYFQRIFGGGRAKLSLARDDDQIYGIDIQASPPGKRIQSLGMLSGGEKALTGIALLAAILAVNPSPFVVLDEVDAALDEANSARFASILRDVAAKSQIIVITHNRQTMSAASVLYGVTMDEHHVSKLLSVKLEQARQLAAR